MKERFRLYRRKASGRFYIEDGLTGKQESLGTSDRTEAGRLLHARNEAEHQPAVNLQIARAYLTAGDPDVSTRRWRFVMDEAANGFGITQINCCMKCSRPGRYSRAYLKSMPRVKPGTTDHRF